MENQPNNAGYNAQEDVAKNKTMAMLAYLLFFLPLVSCPDSKFGRFHANQGLLLLILGAGLGIVQAILNSILFSVLYAGGGWGAWVAISGLMTFLGFAIFVVVVVLFIMGLMNANKGLFKELPVIGKIRIIK